MGALRILIWYPRGLGPDYHGPSIATYRLLGPLRSRHATHVTLVHSNPAQDECLDIVDRYIRIDGPAVDGRISLFAYWRYLKAARKWFRAHSGQFDVLYFPSANKFTLVPARIAQSFGIPVVGRIAAVSELGSATTIRRFLGIGYGRRALIRRMDRIIALSNRIRDMLQDIDIDPGRVCLIANGVNVERFRPATVSQRIALREAYGIPLQAFVVCCVGAITERKGQMLLVEAAARLPSDVHILLAGPYRDDGLEAHMDRVVAEMGMEGRLHRIGHIGDVEQAYQVSDLFCLASTNEGIPNSMIEAMACGLPALGTRISGIEDLIAEGRGRFVGRDACAIADAIGAYYNNSVMLQDEGRISREFVLKELTAEVVADRTMALLSEVYR